MEIRKSKLGQEYIEIKGKDARAELTPGLRLVEQGKMVVLRFRRRVYRLIKLKEENI